MKKGVIIAIIVAYIASILIVQFFGLKVIGVEGNVYITDVKIQGFEFTNRENITDARYHEAIKLEDSSGKEEIHYGGRFIAGNYDKSAESLAANPNRVKVLYDIHPYNATHQEVSFDYDDVSNTNAIYFDEETQEIVFLRPKTVTFTLSTHDGSMVRKEFKISLIIDNTAA